MNEQEAKELKPGQRVSLRQTHDDDGNRLEPDAVRRAEYGVVICAYQDTHDDIDVYVAFFGDKFPEPGASPRRKPYVLRYYAASLNLEPCPTCAC